MGTKRVYKEVDIKKRPPKVDSWSLRPKDSAIGLGIGIAAKDAYVYKQAWGIGTDRKKIVEIKLLIRKGTLVHLSQDKCRAAQAEVISIKPIGKSRQLGAARSMHDYDFQYYPGKIVKPKLAFCKKEGKCRSGIHFYRTLAEARDA